MNGGRPIFRQLPGPLPNSQREVNSPFLFWTNSVTKVVYEGDGPLCPHDPQNDHELFTFEPIVRTRPRADARGGRAKARAGCRGSVASRADGGCVVFGCAAIGASRAPASDDVAEGMAGRVRARSAR